MGNHVRTHSGHGRVQIIALLPEIKKLLDLGWTKKNIYNKFFDEKRTTVSYTHFVYSINRRLDLEKN